MCDVRSRESARHRPSAWYDRPRRLRTIPATAPDPDVTELVRLGVQERVQGLFHGRYDACIEVILDQHLR